MKLNVTVYPVPRLRMSGLIPLLPIPVFVAWTGKTSFPSLYELHKTHGPQTNTALL
jgi:hypothetical protein